MVVYMVTIDHCSFEKKSILMFWHYSDVEYITEYTHKTWITQTDLCFTHLHAGTSGDSWDTHLLPLPASCPFDVLMVTLKGEEKRACVWMTITESHIILASQLKVFIHLDIDTYEPSCVMWRKRLQLRHPLEAVVQASFVTSRSFLANLSSLSCG